MGNTCFIYDLTTEQFTYDLQVELNLGLGFGDRNKHHTFLSYLQLVQDQMSDVSLPVCPQHEDHLPSRIRGLGHKMGEDPHQGVLVLKIKRPGA